MPRAEADRNSWSSRADLSVGLLDIPPLPFNVAADNGVTGRFWYGVGGGLGGNGSGTSGITAWDGVSMKESGGIGGASGNLMGVTGGAALARPHDSVFGTSLGSASIVVE